MGNKPIWRYLSLPKYIDILRTKALYFPKASLFEDDTEGKWWGHAYVYENANKWRQAPENIKTLKGLLDRAGDEPAAIMREVNRLLPTVNEWVRNILLMVKRGMKPEKWGAIIEHTISSWEKSYADHGKSVENWKREIGIHRESTYLSCWNSGPHQSLAMWAMYGGKESVVVRSSEDKLKGLMESSGPYLEQYGLVPGFTKMEYIDGLKNPSPELIERLDDIVLNDGTDINIGLFRIKPSVFSFEEEVRGVIYPKRERFSTDPIVDPYPGRSGFSIPIVTGASGSYKSLADFIDAVYVHPLLTEDSLIFKATKELNHLFGVDNIPVLADRLEAFGSNIMLPSV